MCITLHSNAYFTDKHVLGWCVYFRGFVGLLFVASTLGLCRSDDAELIRVKHFRVVYFLFITVKLLPLVSQILVKSHVFSYFFIFHVRVLHYFQGTTSVTKQTSFMDMLIDLVCIRDASEDPQGRHLYSHGTVRLALLRPVYTQRLRLRHSLTPTMDENACYIKLYRKTQMLGVNRPLG